MAIEEYCDELDCAKITPCSTHSGEVAADRTDNNNKEQAAGEEQDRQKETGSEKPSSSDDKRASEETRPSNEPCSSQPSEQSSVQGEGTSDKSEKPESNEKPSNESENKPLPVEKFERESVATKESVAEEKPEQSEVIASERPSTQSEIIAAKVQAQETKLRDEYGFEFDARFFDAKKLAEFKSSYDPVLERRGKRWQKLLDKIGATGKLPKDKKTKRFCRKGATKSQRGRVWMDVSGATALLKSQAGVYGALQTLDVRDPASVKQIEQDLHRTFPENKYFWSPFDDEKDCHVSVPEKIDQLRNVLQVYSLNNGRKGYCQGLNYIAGLTLLITGNEEKAFWLLFVLLNNLLPDYYSVSMHDVRVDIWVLGELVRKRLPLLHAHLEANNLSVALICTKWFLCLYVDTLPTESVLRVWDSLFFEGWKVLFRVALALFKMSEKELLEIKDPGELYERCKDLGKTQYNCHKLMQVGFSIKLKKKSILKLRGRVPDPIP